MTGTIKYYPKFLAFLQLFYPTLYQELSIYSNKSDVVEANLICSNNTHSFQAIVFSEGDTQKGELLTVYAGKDSTAPYAWDWRWVFAVKILFAGDLIFPIKFKQKVIALPSGKNPLTKIFFNILKDEFSKVINDLVSSYKNKNISIQDAYFEYHISISF